MPKIKAIIGGAKDNVGIALMDLDAGTVLDLKVGDHTVTVRLTEPIAYQHKFSIAPIAPEQGVVKYDEIIGTATRYIDPGQHVHVHNMIGLRLGARLRKQGS